MTNLPLPDPEEEDRHPRHVLVRNLLFLFLGILTLLLGAFLLMGKVGPEVLFVLLLWCIPLFLH
jgi:Ca2+/Na+ antiporter